MFIYLLFVLLMEISRVSAASKCVWVRGAILCHKDPSKQFNVEVRAYDRDGYGVLKVVDPDDLMGITFTEPDGTFQLDGCGKDFDWIPGVVPNNPDPYIKIFHYCNTPKGETLELPEFDTFVPRTHDVGIVILDSKKTTNSPVTFPTINKPRHKLAESEEKGNGQLSLHHLLTKEVTPSKDYKNNSSVLWDSSSIELEDSDSKENKTSIYEERRPNLTKTKFYNNNVTEENSTELVSAKRD
uniref:Transthyretin-like protein n=1 Tax=Meloidogyne javanica TaxID=6303 RepID=A0A915MKW8_MELJA